MADIQSNIQVNIDTSSALASIKALQAQISAFQKEMASSSAANALAAKNLQKGLIDDINATGKFAASIKTVTSTTDYFTRSLEKNKLSLGEYFRYGMASSKSFSRMFESEFNTINKVARERVKDLQTQYISLGKDASGATKAIAIRPLALDLEHVGTKAQIAAQRTQLFNQILKQGSTNLLNFGKNTQWAGRQLMVGFTIPLSIFGAKAAQEFKKLEEQSIRFKRVYGDAMTTPEEADKMIEQLRTLGLEFTKYGVALEATMQLAADAAAMGKTGQDLLGQVSQANILGVLGQVSQEQALETTISLTNAFGYSTEQLADKVNFLNAVENQTVVSIEDLTTAIPKAGPVVQQLGGDVEDLAFFLTAMKEGGINASEGANALKSGLASLINPTEKASNMLLGMGINIKNIVAENNNDVAGIVVDFAQALDSLDPTTRAQAIEQLFGKFQFSRLSTLFQNVIQEGTQASRVLELTNMTTAQLAAMSRKELRNVEESSLYKFQAAIERFNAALAPVGEQFMKMVTPLIEFGTRILNMFNNMSDGAKGFVTAIVGIVGGIAPIFIMTFGLIANAIANGMKGFLFIKNAIQGAKQETTDLGLQTQYMSTEQLEAATVAASLDQVHSKLVQTFTSEAGAIDKLRTALERAAVAQARFGGVRVAGNAPKPKNFANGGMVVAGPGGPKGDKIPANLSDGEVVLSVATVEENPAVVQALLSGQKVQIPGYAESGTAGKSAIREFYAPTGNTYQAAHFSGHTEMSGAQLQEMAAGTRLAAGVEKLFANLMARLEKEALEAGAVFDKAAAELRILNETFDLYDNRVVSLDAELNNILGRSGGESGGTAPVARVQSALQSAGTDAHMQAALTMSTQGATREQQNAAIEQLDAAVQQSMQDFIDDQVKLATGVSDVSDLTKQEYEEAIANIKMSGEDLDRVIQRAYEAVSEKNDQLKAAYEEMSEISGYALAGDLNPNKDKSRNRKGFTGTGTKLYTDTRGQAYENMSQINADQGRDNKFVETQKRKFARVLEDAISQIVEVDPEAFTQVLQNPDAQARLRELSAIAEKYGIKLTQTAMAELQRGFEVGLQKQLDIQSPSKEAEVRGAQTGEGYLDGAESKIDDAKAVGEQTGDALTRAAASRAATYGDLEATPALKSARRKFGSVENIPPEVLSTLTSGMTSAGVEAEKAAINIGAVANKAMAVSGALSSVSFLLQGFGINLGGIGDVVTTLTNSMFALSMATAAAARSTMVMSALNLSGLANIGGLLKGKGLLDGFKTIFSSIRTFGGALTGLSGIVFRFIPYIGLALLAFEGFKFLSNQIQISNEKITGLGDVAKLTAEKLSKIGNAFGFDPAKPTDFGSRIGTSDSTSGSSKSQTGREKLLSGYEGETIEDKFSKFKDDYRAEINGLENATAEQATRALSSTARQMYASGATQEAVDATIKALIEATENNPELQKVDAGKIIGTVFDPTKPGSLQAIQDAAAASAEAYQKAYNLGLATDFGSSVDPESWMAGTYDPSKVTQQQLDAAGVKGNTVTPLSSDATKEQSILASETAASADALFQAFEASSIGAQELIDNVNGLIAPIEGLSETAQARLVPILAEQLGPEFQEQTKDIKDYADVLYMAKYVMAGGVITDEQVNKIKKGTSATSLLSGSFGQLAFETENARKAEERRQEAADNAAYVKQQIVNVSDQIKAYNILRDAGYDSATALSLVNDETLRSEILAAGAADKLGEFGVKLKEYAGLVAQWNKISSSGGGGSGKKTPLQEALESLKEQRGNILNAATAYSKLRKANIDVSTSWKYANDATVAAGLASAKTAKQVKQIVAAIKELEKATAKNAWGNFSKQTADAKIALQNQSKMATILGNVGASAEEIDALINDEGLAAGFKAGTVTAAQLEEALKRIRANSDIELKIKMTTPEGMQSIFDEAYGKVQEAFSAKETQIELDFKLGTNLSGQNKDLVNTKAIDETIKNAEEQIDGLNYKIDDYEAGVQEIAWQEDEVNKKYDARGKALDKIQKVNENIARQNKAQLTIADALSQGDIAAAARAIEDARAEDAAAAIDAQKQALDTAKEQELASLTDSQGRTRAQLEASILDLKKQIFTIEEQTLEPAQKAKSEAEAIKQAAIDSITVLGKNKDEWEAIKNKADIARVNSDKYAKAIQGALDIVNDLVKKWGGLDGKVVTTTHVINTITNGSSTGSTGSSTTTTKPITTTKPTTSTITPAQGQALVARLTGGAPVSSFSAAERAYLNLNSGGSVPGIGDYDKVPSMLTPGEFVMNRSAVGKYGVGMMRAINAGSFVPSMSAPTVSMPATDGGNAPEVSNSGVSATNNNSAVYNYNLSVNVSSSNAGAQEIANAVMGRIKAVNSQRVRGVRI
jgi:TP901 family phage tail tape measure protein